MSSPGQPPKGEATSTPTAGIRTRKADQQSQLDFELEFFEAILGRNPEFIDVLRVHGNNLTLKGCFADGLKIDRRIVDLRPNDALAHYNLACSLALLKRPDEALTMLRRAVEMGYRDFRYMNNDKDLETVRNDPRYRQLVREFGNKKRK